MFAIGRGRAEKLFKFLAGVRNLGKKGVSALPEKIEGRGEEKLSGYVAADPPSAANITGVDQVCKMVVEGAPAKVGAVVFVKNDAELFLRGIAVSLPVPKHQM